MGIKIIIKNKKKYKGEINADIQISSTKVIKPINCPPKLNSGAIDEFLVIFLVNIFILFKAQVYYGNYLKCIWIKMKNLHFQSADA